MRRVTWWAAPPHSVSAAPACGPGHWTPSGSEPHLVVEQAAELDQDRTEELRLGHEHLDIYTGLANYRSS